MLTFKKCDKMLKGDWILKFYKDKLGFDYYLFSRDVEGSLGHAIYINKELFDKLVKVGYKPLRHIVKK